MISILEQATKIKKKVDEEAWRMGLRVRRTGCLFLAHNLSSALLSALHFGTAHVVSLFL
jgi:hypothetical protein